MTVYVFGNPDVPPDDRAFIVTARLKSVFPAIDFQPVAPNADLPFADVDHVRLIDVVAGLPHAALIDQTDLGRLITSPSVTAHDYDLGFQLRYLKKLGRLGRVSILGLPPHGRLNYSLIQSIFKKLVAQDMQGS